MEPLYFGEQVRYYRVLRGLNQDELAQRAQTTPQSISRVENNLQNWTRNNIRKISAALDVPLAALFLPPGADQGRIAAPLAPILVDLVRLGTRVPEAALREVLQVLTRLADTETAVSDWGTTACTTAQAVANVL